MPCLGYLVRREVAVPSLACLLTERRLGLQLLSGGAGLGRGGVNQAKTGADSTGAAHALSTEGLENGRAR
jgi:hypothetical protein